MYVKKKIWSISDINASIRLLRKKLKILSDTISRCTHPHTLGNVKIGSPLFLTQYCSLAVSLGWQGGMRWRQRKTGGSTSQCEKVGQWRCTNSLPHTCTHKHTLTLHFPSYSGLLGCAGIYPAVGFDCRYTCKCTTRAVWEHLCFCKYKNKRNVFLSNYRKFC